MTVRVVPMQAGQVVDMELCEFHLLAALGRNIDEYIIATKIRGSGILNKGSSSIV